MRVASVIGGALVAVASIWIALVATFPGGGIQAHDAAAFVRLYLAEVPGPGAARVRDQMTTVSYQEHNPDFRTDGKAGFSQFWTQVESVSDVNVRVEPDHTDHPIVSYSYHYVNGKTAKGPQGSVWTLRCVGLEVIVPSRDCSPGSIRLEASFTAPSPPSATPSPTPTPLSVEQLALARPVCKPKGSCEVFKVVETTTGTGSVSVAAVNVSNGEYLESVHIMIFNSQGGLNWDQALSTGFGMVRLEKDSSGRVYVQHAVTNDTTEVVLVQILPNAINTFSTIEGKIHPNEFDTADDDGSGAVYVAREGLPGRKFNETTSRDRYVVRDNALEWTGCQVVNPEGEVVEERPIGSTYCLHPVTVRAIELDESNRPEGSPPP